MVLLVDDDEIVLEIGKKMLERIGFTVLSAVDGVEAVEQAQEHASELVCVLLDLTMPRMDGIEAFAEIRKIRPDLPVILCSGYSQQSVTKQFAGKDLSGFLEKPFRFNELSEKLHKVSMQPL